MSKYLLSLLLIIPIAISAQTKVTIDASVTYQTIQGFGASDAWNTDFVGKYWSTSVKEDIAKKLFTKTFDSNGNPEGIGLSRWRFNIGAGSSEQGSESNIEMTERRAECFLNQNGTYTWTKQSGQQWFLNQAKTYGVENLVAFVNSPPRFYTKNGRTNSDNKDIYGSTNLKDGYYDDYAMFLTTILKHFEDDGTHFSQISPVNEPQYEWANGQEGCPWKNQEIKQLAGELNTAIVNNGLSTKILLAEASSYKDLYQMNDNADKCNQIYGFFNTSGSAYIGDYSQVLQGIASHSYWTDGDDSTITSVRQNTYNKSQEQGKIEVYQTEYNLLSKSYDDYLTNSIFLGKMIYADLTIAGASIWDYWTVLERERWNQKNRFYLIRLIPVGGDYGELNTGGTISVNKNLWVLGNYSLFIRPGYKRIQISGANNLSGLMGSAYISPDSTKIIIVYVNLGISSVTISQAFNNLPSDSEISSITPYITDANNNLQVQDAISKNSTYKIQARSVTTLVIDFENTSSSIEQKTDYSELNIYPNPTKGLFQIKVINPESGNIDLTINDMVGNVTCRSNINGSQHQTIDKSDNPFGIHFSQPLKSAHNIVKL